jgi:DNA-binding CsgD family transcriptional regulator
VADDPSDDEFLRQVANAYAQYFHALYGKQRILTAPACAAAVVMHQQSSADIAHQAYRDACYHRPNLSERIALLAPRPDNVWLSVNLYRDDQGSVFSPGEIERITTFAPLVIHAATQHHALHRQHERNAPMAERLTRLCPALSRRELDVLCGVLTGYATAEIAQHIGVKPSSVQTYQKRAYQRLGISGQRQLFALMQSPD